MARDERNDTSRVGSNGPSAHHDVARDGWAIEAIDPAKYAAWSNGDVAGPNTANARVAKVLGHAELRPFNGRGSRAQSR